MAKICLEVSLEASGFCARGWTVVDMKRDWKRVFPFER
jgi:hypothetical protein